MKKNNKLITITLTVIFSIIYIYFINLYNYKLKLNTIVLIFCDLLLPIMFLPILFKNFRKKVTILSCIYLTITLSLIVINLIHNQNIQNLTIEMDSKIDVNKYLPFKFNSKIAKLYKKSSLKLTTNLPILDGTDLTFPLYSSFVNAVYPNTITLGSKFFLYNNNSISTKSCDIFLSSYLSDTQVQDAQTYGTNLKYTQIGCDGLIFFVNKNNPINTLTSSQIKDIYSGEITNWKEVGGENKEITTYQCHESSSERIALQRFMGNTEMLIPRTSLGSTFFGGFSIKIEDYKNTENAIGFTSRYNMANFINNPNIKILKIDGIYPNIKNIYNNSYPITIPIYAITYEGNTNQNVNKLIDWILSEEGQYLVKKTGFSPIR